MTVTDRGRDVEGGTMARFHGFSWYLVGGFKLSVGADPDFNPVRPWRPFSGSGRRPIFEQGTFGVK